MDRLAYSQFWYWIRERHRIYIRRFKEKRPWPWTNDPILQEYKFTNVFRRYDRVTEEMMKRMREAQNEGWRDGDLLFAMFLFRMFNWPPTYDLLARAGLHGEWSEKKAIRILGDARERGEQLYTGAYIITSCGKPIAKHVAMAQAITQLWKHREAIYTLADSSQSLEETWNALLPYPMIGKFIAYELVTDMTYLPVLRDAHDIDSWSNAGPGAMRGLNRIFRGGKSNRPERRAQYLDEMRRLLDKSRSKALRGEHVPEMVLRDIEHCLCEYDKYSRVKNGEGKPRSRFVPPEMRNARSSSKQRQ